MKTHIFAAFILIIAVSQLQVFMFFRHHFSGADRYKAQSETLKHELRELNFENQLVRAELTEFQQHVATLLPDSVKASQGNNQRVYRLRTLASVIVPEDSLQIETATTLFEQGKTLFRERNFESANKVFEKLIAQHPMSSHVLESRFLLMEGLYQLKEYENSLAVTDEMLSLFPDHVLTGFALLRMGQILEIQDRIEDAVEIYKIILNAFSDQQLHDQAEKSIREISL